MMRPYRAVLAACAAFALTVPSYAFGETKRVNATDDFTFERARTRIVAGDSVRWVSTSGFGHTVTAYGGNWSKDVVVLEDEGDTTRQRFRRAGVYNYRCEFHSSLTGGQCGGMCGTVVVLEGAA